MEKKRRSRRPLSKESEPEVAHGDVFSKLEAQARLAEIQLPHLQEEIQSQVALFLTSFLQWSTAREKDGESSIDGLSATDVNGWLNSVETAQACEQAYLAEVDLESKVRWLVREPNLTSVQRAWFFLGMLTHELTTAISYSPTIINDEIVARYKTQLQALRKGNNSRKSKAEADKKRTIEELLRRSKENPRASKNSILENMAKDLKLKLGHKKTLEQRCLGVTLPESK